MSERTKTLGLDAKAGSLVRSGDEVFVGAADKATSKNPRAKAKTPRRDFVEPIMASISAKLT
jgi:hypothetical protein